MLNRRSRHRRHLRGLLVFRMDVPKLAEGSSDLFNYLTCYSEQEEYQELLVAPLALRDGIVRLIEEQAERARRGEPGRITCKMNALTDLRIHERLYEASQTGVRIDLINTVNAWVLKPEGSFARLHRRGDEAPLDSQALLLEEVF
jgi:polyphosphate kinase-like protein